jgi:hypothetical protein
MNINLDFTDLQNVKKILLKFANDNAEKYYGKNSNNIEDYFYYAFFTDVGTWINDLEKQIRKMDLYIEQLEQQIKHKQTS